MPPPTIDGSMSTNDILRTLATSLQPVELEDLDSTVEGAHSQEDVQPFDPIQAGWEQITEEGEFIDSPKFAGKKFLLEAQKTPPKGYEESLTSKIGERDILIKACSNFVEKFVDEGGIQAKIDACRASLAKVTDPALRAKLEVQLRRLENQGREVIEERKNLCQFIPTKIRTLWDPSANPKDIEDVAQEEIQDARKAIRDFEYDLSRAHGKYTKGGKVIHYLDEAVRPERNGLLRGIQNLFSKLQRKSTPKLQLKRGLSEAQDRLLAPVEKQKIGVKEIRDVEDGYDLFLGKIREFSRIAQDPSCSVPKTEDSKGLTQGQRETEKAFEPLKILKEALYVKCGEGVDYRQHVEQTLLQKFSAMPPGSCSEFVLEMTGGVCIPLAVEAGVKYDYTIKVTRDTAGDMKVEICHAGGVKASAGSKIGKFAKAQASVEAKAGTVKTKGYHSPKDAAKALANDKLGPLYLLFINGTGDAIKGLFKKVEKTALKIGAYTDQKFILAAQKHGLLEKVDSFDFRGPNPAYSFDFSGERAAGKTSVGVGAGLIVHANASAIAQIEGQKGTKTIYRSYYAYLTHDRIGEAATIYGRIADNSAQIDNPEAMRELLKQQPATPAEKKDFADQLLAEVKAMIQRETLYSETLIMSDGKLRPPASEVCAFCRQAMTALVALQDKFKALGLPPNQEFTKAVDELKENLVRPRGMAMSKDELIQGLYVSRAYDQDYTTEKFHLGAGIEMTSGLFTDSQSTVKGPSVSADVTLVQLKRTENADKRPFRAQSRMTIDINIGDNLIGKGIVKIIQDKIRQAAGKTKKGISEQGLDPKGIIESLMTGLTTAKDGMVAAQKLAGLTLDEAEKVLSDKILKSSSSSSKLISLQISDGRLTAVGFGSSGSSSTSLKVIAGPVFFETDVSRSSKTITDNNLMAPSFDTLVGTCDDFLVIGHPIEWSQFTTGDNKPAFLRMASVAGGKFAGTDKKAASDLARMQEQAAQMQRDIAASTSSDHRNRLTANFNRYILAWQALAEYFGEHANVAAADEQKVLGLMRDMLEASADHYNILESKGGHIGTLANDEVAHGYDEVDYSKNEKARAVNAETGFVVQDWV